MPEKELPTCGQLERALSQRIQALYHEQLGHRPGKITVTITGEKITILIDEAITQPEKLLADKGNKELMEQVRSDLDQAIKSPLMRLIEELSGVEVVDLLLDTTLETGRTGTIAVLSKEPKLRKSSTRSSSKNQNC